MSAIAGIVRFDGGFVDKGHLRQMLGTMEHHGPDGIRDRSDVSWALGQCMLQTTPEALEATQPLENESGSLVLVMDGRVDNWEELGCRLREEDARLRTRADEELVLRAYELWGRDCLPLIDGDFALALWDGRRQELFCARDRLGVKPFHYHRHGRRIAFATEVGALLDLPWVKEELNEAMVAQCLASEWLSEEQTFWNDVFRLPPAHSMTVSARGPRIERYWTPDVGTEIRYTRDEDYAEHYRALLFDTVRRHARSHRPIACEVSGGLDSSAVFAVAEHMRRREQLPAPGLRGYTLFFGDGSAADEIAYARAVARHLDCEIEEVAPTLRGIRWYLEAARAERDFPRLPNGVMHEAIIDAAASSGCRVVLSGVGGDHWLAGSRSYYAELVRAFQLGSLMRAAGYDVSDFGARRAMILQARWSLYQGLPAGAKAALRRLRSAHRQGGKSVSVLMLSPRLRSLLPDRRVPAVVPAARPGQAEILGTLANPFTAITAQVVGLQAAKFGMELRCPYFSHHIVQFAVSTSPALRVRGKFNKFLHRRALQGLLPPRVQQRRTKAIFDTVMRHGLDDRQFLSELEKHALALDWADRDDLQQLFAATRGPAPPGAAMVGFWRLVTCIGCADSIGKKR